MLRIVTSGNGPGRMLAMSNSMIDGCETPKPYSLPFGPIARTYGGS